MDSLANEPDPGPEPEVMESVAKDNTQPTPPTFLDDKETSLNLLVNGESTKEMTKSPSEPELDSAALDRQKHIVRGMAIYESAIKEHKVKTEADKLMEAVAKLDKCNEFVVQLVDISFESEVLGTRLEEGTNRKRAQTINLEYLNHHNHLLNLANVQEHDDDCRAARSRSEEVDTEACARARSIQILGETAPRAEEGHNGDEMSERSSGTKRRTRSSLVATIESPANLLTGADTSGTLEEEITESADPNEVGFPTVVFPRAEVGEAVVESSARLHMDSNTANITTSQPIYIPGSSKRIRPNQGRKVVEKEDKGLRLAESPKEEIDALSTPDTYDQKAATTSSEAPKTRIWSARERYNNPKLSSGPDYGPLAHVPKLPRQADGEMPVYSGGPKPTNDFRRPSGANPNPSYKLPRPAIPKPFDLTGDANRSRRQHEHPAKRQRVDSGSSTSPIEVDESTQYHPKHSGPSSARSGHSQTLHSRDRSASFGTRDGGLQEVRTVGRTIKLPRSRNRSGAADDSTSVINGSQRFSKNSFDQTSREDKNDRISDDEVTITKTAPRKSDKKLEVQIQAYQGSAHRNPPRPKANASSRISNSPSMEIADESRYFPSTRGSSRHQGDSREQPQGSRTNSRAEQDHSLLSQDDRDELSTDQFGNAKHADTAQRLLKKNQPSKLRDQGDQGVPVNLDDSSEDEISKPDIEPGKYGCSQGNPQQARGEDSYTVLQVFSETAKWLLPGGPSRWVMEHNTKAGVLSVYDASDKLILQIPTKELDKIEVSDRGSKMVLHKSRSQMAKGAINVFIEMRSTDECEQLFRSLKSIDPALRRIPKPQDHLNRVFRNMAEKAIQTKRQRPLPQEEPDDIRLAKAKSEKLFGAKWAEAQGAKKSSANGNDTGQRNGNLEKGARSKGVGKGMRGRSPGNDDLEVEEVRQTSNAPVFSPGDFYGNSSNSKHSGADSHVTRSSGRLTAKRDTSPVYRQSQRQRPRSPSPEPERWTTQNPEWTTENNWQSSVIYPPGGKNKASVDMQDIQRLDEGEFLNDNLIVFYLRWLEDRLGRNNPELASRIYFTNTFFYERLTTNIKGKSGGINYEAVERWTAKIDLLKYDYIVVPVNETVHWYVAIICNAPKLLKQLPSENTSQEDAKIDDAEAKSHKIEVEAESMTLPLKSPAKTLPDEVDTEMKEMTLEDNNTKRSRTDIPDVPVPTEVSKDTEKVDLDLPRAKVVSDVVEQQPTQSRKGKRKSTPAPRKYNPDEPRIITLDSLGLSHSPTCTNLRKYLLKEIKAKKNIEIKDPGPLGMTAKNIPQQNNHCDCGLFLLTYIEEFLKRPDGFVHDLLQQNEQDFSRWRSASDMRKHIRNLLFNLQQEQAHEAEVSRNEKIKSKQAANAGDKSASASSSKPSSREASKSARGSPNPGKAEHMPETKDSRPEKSKKHQEITQSSVQSPPEKVDSHPPTKARSSKSNAVESHDDEVREDSRETPSMVARIIATAQSTLNHVFGCEENDLVGGRVFDVKATESQPINIDGSQEMDGQEYAVATPNQVCKTNKPKAGRSPVLEESRHSKHARPENTIEIPESPQKPSPRKELPEAVFITHHPLINSSQGEEQDQHQSSRAGRRTKDPKIRSSGRAKAADRLSNEQDALQWNGCDAIDPDSSNNEVQLVDSTPRRLHNGVVAHAQQYDDDDLLLQNTPRPGPPNVHFLTSSSPEVISKPTDSVTKRSRGNTAPTSPSDTKRHSSHIAENGTSPTKRRKIVAEAVDLALELPSPEAKQRGRAARSQFRDASDLAVLGKKGAHLHFDESVLEVDKP